VSGRASRLQNFFLSDEVVASEQGPNDLHTVQLMPLLPVLSCFIKIQIGLTFLVLAYQSCAAKEAVKWVFCFCSTATASKMCYSQQKNTA